MKKLTPPKPSPGSTASALTRNRAKRDSRPHFPSDKSRQNIHDELKNPWGWCGYTTQKLAPSRLMANLIALVYNWWHLYARLYDGDHHREAITSRPALLHGVARLTRSGGQRTVKVSIAHEKSDLINAAIMDVSNTLHRFHAIAEQWTHEQRWSLLLTHIFGHWLGGKWLSHLPSSAEPLLSG